MMVVVLVISDRAFLKKKNFKILLVGELQLYAMTVFIYTNLLGTYKENLVKLLSKTCMHVAFFVFKFALNYC